MTLAEGDLRRAIVAICRAMNDLGINQGTSGNASARSGERMLISPSATPYDRMEPDMVAAMPLDDPNGAWEGPLQPSTEWRLHQRLLRGREDANAVVHAHPTCCTALAMARRPIPACHYMIAAFGGGDVRCAGYAAFGTAELADLAFEAMRDRSACLLANHGMVALGATLEEAIWRAVELETLARQYVHALQIGGPALLSEVEVDETLAGIRNYGGWKDGRKLAT